MSRKRTPLHQSINSLAASIPDIPLALGDDDAITAVATISPDGEIKVTAVDPAYGEDFAVRSTIEITPDGVKNLMSGEILGDVGDHVVGSNEMVPERGVIVSSSPDGSVTTTVFHPATIRPWTPAELFTKWSLTPEGHRVRDSRIPTDPVRLGCIMDDNARIAFMAGYAAATPSFE